MITQDDVQEHAQAIGVSLGDDVRAARLAEEANEQVREFLSRELREETIDAVVEAMADEAENAIRDHDTPYQDAIFEAVDSRWPDFGIPEGRIAEWPTNPGADVLARCAKVLDYCAEEAWVEDDSGLWQGLEGGAVIGTQAFFSVQNVVWEKLRNRGVID